MPTPRIRYSKNDQVVFFVTWLFFFLFHITGSSTVLAGFAVLMLLITNYKFEAFPFHILTIQFCLYCYATAFWALNGRICIDIGNSIFLTLACLYIFYGYFSKVQNVMVLAKIFMWGGYAVIFYTFFYYGIDNIIAAEENRRLDSSFANVNTIAMLAATAIIINVYFYLFEKRSASLLLAIPGIMVIASTQSRKAYVMLVLGVFLLYYIKMVHSGKKKPPVLKIITYFAIGLTLVFLLGTTSFFAGINERMLGMIASITGQGEVDSSSSIRAVYREIGWGQFMETPLTGIGMGNAQIIVSRSLGFITYLHDNYAEIACDGGILGLISYYSIYLYILVNELRYVKKDSSAILVEVWVAIRLITDIGAVSYSNKITYIYLMFFFLHLTDMQKKYPPKQKYNKQLVPSFKK